MKVNKSYTEEDLLIYIHKLRSNWEDLKKWLERMKENSKYNVNALDRQATYDKVLDKMIGLEGRDKND